MDRTRQNTINQVIGLTPVEILGPNPKRKAFLFMPIPGNSGITKIMAAQVFNAGAGQVFTVPNDVWNIVDVYAWGAGGNSGAPGAVLGGGGGGGGSIATLGSLDVVPGEQYGVGVGAAGSGTASTFINPAATTLLSAPAGVTAVLDALGAGGAAGTGTRKFAGANGIAATGLAGNGGGGGGAAGTFAAGSVGAAEVGGVGGGAVTRTPYGIGGSGGNGGLTTLAGVAGLSPGGGGGGPGNNGPAASLGSPGMVVVFYLLSDNTKVISLSHRQDVIAGQGVLNYLPSGGVWPSVCDCEIGDAITLPWYIISGVDSVPVQIVEYSYED